MPMRWIWSASLALSLLVLSALHTIAPLLEILKQQVKLDGAEVAAIGTSLMGSGLAWNADLLHTGRAAQRLALGAMQADQALDIAEESLRQGAQIIVIEAQPFLYSLRQQRHRQRNLWGESHHDWRQQLSLQVSQALRQTLLHALGIHRPRWYTDLPTDPEFAIDTAALQRFPPPLIEPPHAARLTILIKAAAMQDVRLLFVVMPISTTAADIDGLSYRQAFIDHAHRFAAAYGVELWIPTFAWPDSHFYDRAHMNATGRARFTAALSRYLTDEPT